jgi:hypothetical protein
MSGTSPRYIGYSTPSILTKALEYGLSKEHLIHYNLNQNIVDYSLYFSDKPEDLVRFIDDIISYHINTIAYIRNPPANQLKKEDKFLILEKIANRNIVFRNVDIQKLWIDDNQQKYSYLEYGIPDIGKAQSGDRQSVIVINYDKSHNLKLLFLQIQQTFSDAVMLDSIDNLSYKQICDILQKFKVCITTGDSYNTLCAAANNCLVYTTDHIPNIDSTHIDSFDAICRSLPVSVKNYDNTKIDNSQILSNYNFDNFEKYFNLTIDNILRKPLVL